MSCFPAFVYDDQSPTHYPERHSGRRGASTPVAVYDRRVTHAGYVEIPTVVSD
jgi:hypothetical protein